jgi:hypothetical protein
MIGSGLVDMIGTSRPGSVIKPQGSQIPANNLPYGVKATAVCFRGAKAPKRRNLGAASLISFVIARLTRTQCQWQSRSAALLRLSVRHKLD